MLKFIPLLTAAILALPVPMLAQDAGAVLRIIEAQDQIVRIQAKTRHTTVIVLPASEDILDFVVGDSEYWHLTGAANLAFLKPIAEGVTTNVALVCASGRIYSFLVTEGSAGEPHLIVRVEHPQIDDPRISPGVNTPAFVRRSQVTAYQEMAETAMKTVATVQEEAEVRVAEAKALAEGETEAFRSDYPTRLNFPYRLEDKAIKWPFLVEGMWNDGQFTYLRSNAQETPALYEEKDGKPALVAYDLEEDGLYIARHVLGNGWLQIGKEKAKWRFTAPRGEAVSSGWKRLYPKPAGSLPGGIVTQWGVALITVLILIFVALWLASGGTEQAEIDSIGGEVTGPARNFAGQMAAQVEAEALRAETRRAAAARTLQAQQRQEARGAATGAIGGGELTMDEALLLAGPSPETGRAYTTEEFELRERLRLEALERRSRSLRSSPVAQTYRQLDRARSPAEAGAEPGPVEAIRAEGAAALAQALGTFEGATTGLEDEIAAEAESDQAFLRALTGAQQGGGPGAGAAAAPHSLGFPGAAAQPSRDYANPSRLEGGDDPPGWERIYEGSFLEAVLVTQLSGDFPGPVLAQVAVPFYSADRQRVLVPRGARVIGTASAVIGQDQERLAVSFHRLIYPDGRWVTLDFHGLNQVGEGALKDRVNRHYFSMFAAVGAVGIISGLTLQNSNPYGGGAQAFRAGAGQGLGQAAEQILQRFLNRLPTLTIRAGHRLRIWFTSDVLVPRNLKGE